MAPRKQQYPIPDDAPEVTLCEGTYTYDPYQHQTRRPDGKIWTDIPCGYSPSDLKDWALRQHEHGSMTDDVVHKLMIFCEQCRTYKPRMRYWGKGGSRIRRWKNATNRRKTINRADRQRTGGQHVLSPAAGYARPDAA